MRIRDIRRRLRALAPMALAALAALASLGSAGCLTTRYVIQAGMGQAELWGESRAIDDVLEDARTDERTRVLLREVGEVRRFAEARGLATKGNYRSYVALDRPAVVWFLAASRPLSFEPKLWHFPIVGSFPYTGWFDEREALKMAALLRDHGYETFLRPVRAYSTGGWFRDPVLSSMFSSRDDALRDLVNVLLHELTHANILVSDQSTFNESIASFVGDTMTEEYLGARFGADSEELRVYREELAASRVRGARLAAAYAELAALYASDAGDDDKRARKQRILSQLDAELKLPYRPNNAAMLGFKTYNAGLDEFAALFATCGRDWPRFFAAIDTLAPGAFPKPQAEDIGPVIDALAARGCPAAPRS
ncbi:aminopeptidase [Haliangium ochraceum]|nr:aminopeptidase [Haliangium ochraceum]